MSLDKSIIWEVRPATGSDSNGGGFLSGGSGTDYSQQASPQVTFNGTTITATTAGISTTLTLSGYTVADTDVGNIIQVSGGTNFTTGFYQILSVNTGTNTWTLDRSPTSAAGTAMTGAMGGAFATASKATTAAVGSNTIYIKGTLTVTAVLNITTSSDFGQPLIYNGYSTARDDGTRATWTTATNSMSLIDVSTAINVLFKNINFTNTAGTKGTGSNGNAIMAKTGNAGSITVSKCSFDGFNLAINADFVTIFTIINLQLDNVEIKNSVSHGVLTTGSTAAAGCFFHGNGGDGFHIDGSISSGSYNFPFMFFSCVFYNNTGNGLTNPSSQSATITGGANVMLGLFNCVFASNTGDGVNSPANHCGASMVWNCIFWNNGGWGWNSATANNLVNAIPRCNAFGSNTSGARQNFPTGIGDVAITTSPFTSIGTDFSLNNTASAGAACRAAGFPGAATFGTGFADIGALQHQASGGGGSLVFARALSGGMG